jgi:hypothetical protein
MGVYYGIHIMIYIYTYIYIADGPMGVADGGFNQLVSEVTPGQRLA